MSLNISQLCERVASEVGFSSVEKVGDSVIRSTRNSDELPFAVYYFDITSELPRTQKTLTEYQDQVIGSRYFEGRKSLQWSNYLYFITSRDCLRSSDILQRKEMIERDRNYARKFVISEDELESVLKPPMVAPSESILQANILSVWTDLLVKAGLDRAILSDDKLPKRLLVIEQSSPEPTNHSKNLEQITRIEAAPFIDSLQLKKYRRFPEQRLFDFSTVNLIFGANGSGKTSLLEAIELFYCGRNKRNRKDSQPYELIVRLANNESEKATNLRKQKIFRDRNLAWYGQSEVKTNEVYQSFAQFNFLDTDAAVSLADSTTRIDDDLSKLLVGPDASKTWHNIEIVNEAVTVKLRNLQPLENQIKDELIELDRQLKEANEVKQESDSIRARLEDMIQRAGWTFSQSHKEVFASSIMESLTELESLTEQATSLEWIESPVSIDGLARYCHESKKRSAIAEKDIARLQSSQNNEKRQFDKVIRCQKSLNLAKQVKRFIDAGFHSLTKEIEKQQSIVDKYSNWLTGYNDNIIGVLFSGEQDAVTTKYYEKTITMRSKAENILTNTKIKYANYNKQREQSINLSQQLREIAVKILHNSPTPDDCPLCHTKFPPDGLVKQINQGIDEHLESEGQKLLTLLREQELLIRDTFTTETALAWIINFCEKASLASDIAVNSVLLEVDNAKLLLTDAQSQLETLSMELLKLKKQKLTLKIWDDILRQLDDFEYPISEFTNYSIDRLISVINQDLSNSSLSLETERKLSYELQQTLCTYLASVESGVQSLKKALSQLKERYTTTESIRGKLLSLTSFHPWPGNRPLGELTVEATAIRKVAAELQMAIGKEKQAKVTSTESIKRKKELSNQITLLHQQIKRLIEAQTTFKTILKKHSLSGAMQSALKQNHKGIESIFSRIHSPADFLGLGSNLTTLIRKANGETASLSQISTGQRAAFALSIFLAQNAQLNVAPPVILIDDPIAHIDDLNSLSFLDYLREIILTGRRQLFFTTANEKLASLFERKFDFLGEKGFRRINLVRME